MTRLDELAEKGVLLPMVSIIEQVEKGGDVSVVGTQVGIKL